MLLNTPRAGDELAGAAEWVAGDGRRLPFRDQSFDVVFSNSVIEHVGDVESQRRFAREVARVGRAWWVADPQSLVSGGAAPADAAGPLAAAALAAGDRPTVECMVGVGAGKRGPAGILYCTLLE